MYDNLVSFCQQDYPHYQIIFGLHRADDPALKIIKQVQQQFPDLDISVVVDAKLHGTNHKVSSLINMYGQAKHDFLLIADSDMRVGPGYLSAVMAPFADEGIGAVTCLYSGSAHGGIASRLNAMFINNWFLPSVLISGIVQKTTFCLGATMIVRRRLLEQAGGFSYLKDHLADDYMLGKLVTDAGYSIHVSDYVVTNIVEEVSFKSLLLHELRWVRTLRTVEPIGFVSTFITDTFVISVVTAVLLALLGSPIFAVMLVSMALFCRFLVLRIVKSRLNLHNAGSAWLIPLRDTLSFVLRIASFTGSSIHWRNESFSVDSRGVLHESEPPRVIPEREEEIATLATNQDY